MTIQNQFTLPRFTLGLATFDDFHGAIFSIQYARLMHRELLRYAEIVVVDQNPTGVHAKQLQGELNGIVPAQNIKYVPYTKRVGTSAGRDVIVETATAPIVAVIDSHVFNAPKSLDNMLAYLENPKHAKDIYSGPILNTCIYRPDDRNAYSCLATHYAHHLRKEMLGTWSTSFLCPCGQSRFAMWEERGMAKAETVSMNPERVQRCPVCDKKIPIMHYSGHHGVLEAAGYKNEGDYGKEIFEIPAMGLGFYAFRKEAWPGFNKDVWGFGGEEIFIHELFRKNGGRAVCDPNSPWWHRWGKTDQGNYPNSQWYKCRNYILEYKQLGWDTEELRKHFVEEQGMRLNEFNILLADPVNRMHGPDDSFHQPIMVNGKPLSARKRTADEIFNQFCDNPRDLDKHLGFMRELALQVGSVCEFGKRQESLAAWVVAGVGRIESHNAEQKAEYQALVEIFKEGGGEITVDNRPALAVESIQETDLLWLDTVHHYDRTRGELQKFAKSVTRYIVVRGTGEFGFNAEGGGPGMFGALREFVDENPEWFVMYHTTVEYGITVLSKNEEDRPVETILPWPPGHGPGTELKAILAGLGFQPKQNCGCEAKAREMDILGVEGCREHRERLLTDIKANAVNWGWDIVRAIPAAVWSGLAFQVSVLDPIPDVFDIAVDKAEATAAKLKVEREARKAAAAAKAGI